MELNTVFQYLSHYGIAFIFIIIFLEYLNMPGLAAAIVMPAGLLKLNFAKFITYSFVAIIIYNGAFISAGYFLGYGVFKIIG